MAERGHPTSARRGDPAVDQHDDDDRTGGWGINSKQPAGNRSHGEGGRGGGKTAALDGRDDDGRTMVAAVEVATAHSDGAAAVGTAAAGAAVVATAAAIAPVPLPVPLPAIGASFGNVDPNFSDSSDRAWMGSMPNDRRKSRDGEPFTDFTLPTLIDGESSGPPPLPLPPCLPDDGGAKLALPNDRRCRRSRLPLVLLAPPPPLLLLLLLLLPPPLPAAPPPVPLPPFAWRK